MEGWPSGSRRALKEFAEILIEATTKKECPSCVALRALVGRLNKDNEGLNRMLRESQAGQGPIDCYVAQCETIDLYRALLLEVINPNTEAAIKYHLNLIDNELAERIKKAVGEEP